MGEIRIKSGNLYTIELGDDRWRTLGNGQIISRTDGVLQIEMTSEKNSGVYAVSTSAIGQLSDIRSTVSYSFDIRADTDISVLVGYEVQGARVLLQVSDEWVTVKVENILFTQSYSFTIVNRSSGGTVYLRNFMLNLGSTALPYQPYFLNRPAHQFVNGQWVDIPTHKYTNNRWQGELTSQSPLKFRATGQSLLDWRIEGRTSENLFDVKHFVDTAYCHNVVLTQLNNGIRIQATSSNDPYANYVNGVIGQTLPVNMRNAVIPCKSNIDYTLYCAQSSRIGKYISYFDKDYKVVKNYTPFSGTPINFKTPETCVYILLRIGDSSTLSEGTTIELTNIQILEGIYTTSTIPPYEPYGGVGDWDETEQKYRIPVTVEGENLFDVTTVTNVYLDVQGVEHSSEVSRTSDYIPVTANTLYTLGMTGSSSSINLTAYCFYDKNKEFLSSNTYQPSTIGNIVSITTTNNCAYFRFTYNHLRELVEFVEGSYTTLPPYSTTTNLFTDHQLLDGDSIDYATDQTTIPIATGNNVLTVDTAVKPSKVFVKFEG